uniref:Uncharacterized protein n=1 Tax=viral metagenome TaxID=1070528 RepID=A0A6M3IJP5_9ZZZZ
MGLKSRGNWNLPFCTKSKKCKFYEEAPEKCASCFKFSRFIHKSTISYKKEPCKHPGCVNHITHPCEECGR